MNDWLGYLILAGIAALAVYIRTFIKSTVEKSIGHEFDERLETFKQDFAREQEARERKDKFRLAALEKRLEVHQRAFALARGMIHTLNSAEQEERNELAKECRTFWDEQSLYLSNEIRKQFQESSFFYNFYVQQIEEMIDLKETEPVAYKKANEDLFAGREKLRQLPSIIEKAVDLEAMGNEDIPKNE